MVIVVESTTKPKKEYVVMELTHVFHDLCENPGILTGQ